MSVATRYEHVGGYRADFVDGRQRYAVTTRRLDGEAILPSGLERAANASQRAARRLGLTGPLTTSVVYVYRPDGLRSDRFEYVITQEVDR